MENLIDPRTLWHDISEEPQEDRRVILLVDKYKCYGLITIQYGVYKFGWYEYNTWEELLEDYEGVCWCYCDDINFFEYTWKTGAV